MPQGSSSSDLCVADCAVTIRGILLSAGRHPPWHLPAANVLRPYQAHAISHTSCYV